MPDQQDILQMVLNAAQAHGVDPALLTKLVHVESGFNPSAINSSTGAIGLGQLMPGTAAGLGVTDPTDPQQNINGAAAYLRQGLDKYGGDTTKALMYYYGGPNEASWGPKTAAYPGLVLGGQLPAQRAAVAGAGLLGGASGPMNPIPNIGSGASASANPSTGPAQAPTAPASSSQSSLGFTPLMALGLAPKLKFTPIDYDPFKIAQAEQLGGANAGVPSAGISGAIPRPQIPGTKTSPLTIAAAGPAPGSITPYMTFIGRQSVWNTDNS